MFCTHDDNRTYADFQKLEILAWHPCLVKGPLPPTTLSLTHNLTSGGIKCPSIVLATAFHPKGFLFLQVPWYYENFYPVLIQLPSLSASSSTFFFFCLFVFSRATPTAYGGSQARGLIGAVAAGLHQSHSNAGSKLRLQPTPQLTAKLDP